MAKETTEFDVKNFFGQQYAKKAKHKPSREGDKKERKVQYEAERDSKKHKPNKKYKRKNLEIEQDDFEEVDTLEKTKRFVDAEQEISKHYNHNSCFIRYYGFDEHGYYPTSRTIFLPKYAWEAVADWLAMWGTSSLDEEDLREISSIVTDKSWELFERDIPHYLREDVNKIWDNENSGEFKILLTIQLLERG